MHRTGLYCFHIIFIISLFALIYIGCNNKKEPSVPSFQTGGSFDTETTGGAGAGGIPVTGGMSTTGGMSATVGTGAAGGTDATGGTEANGGTVATGGTGGTKVGTDEGVTVRDASGVGGASGTEAGGTGAIGGDSATTGGTDGATGGNGESGGTQTSWNDVYALIQVDCSTCHTIRSSGGLSMANSQVAYDNLVGVSAQGCPSEIRVIAGNANDSYIIKKIEGRQPFGCGSRMPPTRSLDSATTSTFRSWIDEGATP